MPNIGDSAHVGRPNKYRPAGAVRCERGRYAALKRWLAVQIDAKFFIQLIEQGAYNLRFIVFAEGGISAGTVPTKAPDMKGRI